ncbi:PIN domain-containing protein [Candidatus Daviesbacteria bacterium]|nr:PIN domain-containing protein [Candidatus Daviesbacteria bacterium]
MKIFIDTNLWVRFFIQDVADQYEITKNLLAKVEAGELRAYTSTIVLLELQFVLQKIYKLSFAGVLEVFEIIQKVREMTIIEKTNFNLALEFYRKYKVKFPDCLISSQIPQNTILVSFDEELSKIKEITVKKPQEILVNKS